MPRARVRSPRVALATWAGLPNLGPDDRRLADALTALGAEAVPCVWNDPRVAWGDFDLVVVRSTWDYHRHLRAFLAWTRRVARSTRLCNDVATIGWNARKTYLRALEREGLPIIPTRWIGRVGELTGLPKDGTWRRVVLKPVVGASAEGAVVFEKADQEGARGHFRRLRRHGLVMAQPYLETVEHRGERSLVFLDGRFSHAVLRKASLATRGGPRDGAPVRVSDAELRLARRVVRHLPRRPLYARVDMVDRLPDGAPALMEVELIEPLLYLARSPDAAGVLARAIVRSARAGRSSASRPSRRFAPDVPGRPVTSRRPRP
ncbi:MAG TPA: hypothetical protein VMH49_05680 [Thermoplasmata archaeon]|nr:hypothetical protein [Thermoplasmata archaeon]